MKKYIVILMVAAFAAVSYAGDKGATVKTTKVKAVSADAKSACAAEGACSANAQVAKKSCNGKKIVMSPKAAGEVGR